MLLYKYTRAKHIRSILELGRFAFPRVAELNDPFESSVEATLRELRTDYRQDYKMLPLRARQPVVKYRMVNGLFSDVGINPDFDPHNENIELHNKEVARENTRIQQMNDRLRRGIELLERFRSDVGVLSLTRDPSNVVMWAHYAENSSGVCIGIDVSHAFFDQYRPTEEVFGVYPELFRVAPVSYERRRPSHSGGSPAEYMNRAFFTKYEKWAYEEEVRVLRPVGDCTEMESIPLLEVPAEAIKEVIIGVRASKATREIVESLAARMPHLALRVAQIPKNEYEIRLMELRDADLPSAGAVP